MATQPKKIFGIHTYTKESTPATAPNTSEILSKKTYINIRPTPIAKFTPVPPLLFLKANATAIIVKI